jgi:hypothetical protein
MKKGTIPAGASFDRAQDEFFERTSLQGLRDIHPSRWAAAQGIWTGLPQCWPATRRRILAQALKICCDQHYAPAQILVDRIVSELDVSAAPRNRAEDADLMTEVAYYLVRNPRTPYRKIASALNRHGQESTIYRMFENPEFWKECAEQSAGYDDEIAHDVLERYLERFGHTFSYGTEDTRFIALAQLVPSMIDALAEEAPALTNEHVRAIAANQKKIRSEAALRRRLLPASQ